MALKIVLLAALAAVAVTDVAVAIVGSRSTNFRGALRLREETKCGQNKAICLSTKLCRNLQGTKLRSASTDCKKSGEICCKSMRSGLEGLLTRVQAHRAEQQSIRIDKESRAMERARRDMDRVFPPVPERGEMLIQTWLSNAILKMHKGSFGPGKKRADFNEMHEITFMPGRARYPNKHDPGRADMCVHYELETNNYGVCGAGHKLPACAHESMRAADLCATANPVAPIVDGRGDIFTLWEARSNDDSKSKLFASIHGGTGLRLLKDLAAGGAPDFTPTYGGECEVKKIKVFYKKSGDGTWANPKTSKTATRAIYGRHLLTIKYRGTKVMKLEGESASAEGAGIWVEFVTYPLPLEQEWVDKVRALYTNLARVGSAHISLSDLAARLSGEGWTAEVPEDPEPLPPKWDGIKMGDLGIHGLNEVNSESGGVVCQGNYLLPLKMLHMERAHFVGSDGIKGAVWEDAQKYANEMVSRLDPEAGPGTHPNLRGALAIYLLNGYWFTHLKSNADTVKDNWGQLPKTPVLDIVRALPVAEKQVLLRQFEV